MMLLLAHGGSINARRDTGATPLFSAVQHNASIDLITLLLDSGADIEAETHVRFSLCAYYDLANIPK